MSKEVARYRRILKRNLHCGRGKRQELLEQFDCVLYSFLEDCPVPLYTQLTEAFGPPGGNGICYDGEGVSGRTAAVQEKKYDS